MSTVRVYHDGWIALPESVRKRLQVTVGDLLWISVDNHRLVLSPSPQPAESGNGSAHKAGDGDGRGGQAPRAEKLAVADDPSFVATTSRRRAGGRATNGDGSRPAPRAKRVGAGKSDRTWSS